jgi:predicted nucleotidyltransferase
MKVSEIQKKKEEKMKQTAENLGVDLILLFGSRADDTNRSNSDFDVAYRSKKPLESESQLFRAMMNHLGSENLHLMNLQNIKPLTLYEIVRNCKVLYAKNMMDFYNLRACAFRRFEDEVKPLYEIISNKLKRQYSV